MQRLDTLWLLLSCERYETNFYDCYFSNSNLRFLVRGDRMGGYWAMGATPCILHSYYHLFIRFFVGLLLVRFFLEILSVGSSASFWMDLKGKGWEGKDGKGNGMLIRR